MMQNFFAMGGYAFYVWTAFGVVGVVLLINLILPLLRQRKLLKKL